MPPRNRLGQASNRVPPKGGWAMPPATGLEQASNRVPPKGG
jgi:hypothetical protein